MRARRRCRPAERVRFRTGQDDTNILTVLECIPGTMLGVGLVYFIADRRVSEAGMPGIPPSRVRSTNGTWYSSANRPANGAYWYANGLGVDCARTAASYVVRFAPRDLDHVVSRDRRQVVPIGRSAGDLRERLQRAADLLTI